MGERRWEGRGRGWEKRKREEGRDGRNREKELWKLWSMVGKKRNGIEGNIRGGEAIRFRSKDSSLSTGANTDPGNLEKNFNKHTQTHKNCDEHGYNILAHTVS